MNQPTIISEDFEEIDMDQVKHCSKCDSVKPISEFRKVKKKIKSSGSIRYSIYCHCKKCECIRVNEYAKNNPEYEAKRKESSKRSWEKYGDKYKKKYNKKAAIKFKERYNNDSEFREFISRRYKRRNDKKKVLKEFKRKPKPVEGYSLSKNDSGMWVFTLIK